jgi:predicted RNA binding protein YcfA (HicA-like mRNA interferase family)
VENEHGRSTTLPVHGGRQIGPPLFYRILEQLGIDEDTFSRLR